MATLPKSKPKFDFAAAQQQLLAQFRGLNPNDPSTWPLLPRLGLCLLAAAAIVGALWFLWIVGSSDQLTAEQAKETQLRDTYQKKLAQAVNLEVLKKQREQVQQYVTQLEKQLPSKAEMDALLSDINQAGLGRSLQFESFKPGVVSVKEYYAELPIAIKVTGRYHDMGSFASDIANLSRIVTLNNLILLPSKEAGSLTMEATAKTFRYLDPEEVAAQRKAAAPAAKAKK
ncbi:MAG: type 4a pilus biogenesis protein PilO [Burkholderiaceae bacterium]